MKGMRPAPKARQNCTQRETNDLGTEKQQKINKQFFIAKKHNSQKVVQCQIYICSALPGERCLQFNFPARSQSISPSLQQKIPHFYQLHSEIRLVGVIDGPLLDIKWGGGGGGGGGGNGGK